jgi:V-type H+-transporting ATPase subunit C
MSTTGGQQFWLIACGCPEGDTKEHMHQVLKDRVSSLCADGFKPCTFDVPDTLKFGSFDNLIRLMDDLQKYDSQVESTLRRIERQLLELNPNAEFKIISQRTQQGWEQYIRKFPWDDAKFPRSRNINDNLQLLLGSVQKLDEEVRNKSSQFAELKTQVANVTKKDNATLATRDLVDVLTPNNTLADDFIVTEHLTTVVVVVGRGQEKEWLSCYERLESYVVPLSAKKFNKVEDKEGNTLWRVVLFKSALEGFKKSAKEKKFIVRDFIYNPANYTRLVEQRGALEAEAKKQETFLRRVCHAAFSDSLVSWMHLKAMRVFVEAVLRFGVPPNFAGFLIKPGQKTQRLRQELENIFSASGMFGQQYHQASAVQGGGEEGGEDYYPYVSLNFMPVSASSN